MSPGRMTRSKASRGLPGQRLQALRITLRMSMRDVQSYSDLIAKTYKKDNYYISISSLAAIENRSALPSIYKLFTLSIIYRINFYDLLLLYDIDLEQISSAQLAVKLPRTHLVPSEIYDPEKRITFPVKFSAGAVLEETSLLYRMVERWAELPVGFLQHHLALQKYQYGFIGLDDDTLYPLIRPAAFVQIDDQDTKIAESGWENEFERPIYFLRLRAGCIFGWCDVQENVLTVVSSQLSRTPIRRFDLSSEVEVIGRIVGVAMSLRHGRRQDRRDLGAFDLTE